MANNDKVVVKKEKQGFFEKIGSSIASIPIGIFLVIFGVFSLASNEKANVNNIKSVKELRDQIIDISSSKIDAKNDGKLVALSGKLEYGEIPLVDTTFNVTAKAPKLERVVEMYEWVETATEKDDKITYTYSKDWSDKIIDSSEFNTSTNHENPAVMPIEGTVITVEDDLKVGAFTLIDSFKDQIQTDDSYRDFTNVVLPEGYIIDNKYITNSADATNPQVGDIRISYKIANYSSVSVLGKQIDNTIGAYDTKTNSTFAKLYKGTKNSTQMINSIESGNKFSKWTRRLFGALLIIFGLSLILGPVTTLIGYIPFLGNIVNSMIGVISFILGLIISLIVIAISWFVVRPILSICLLVVVAGLVVGIIYLKKIKSQPTEEKK